ncbi:iron-siderophore ABC transporter substrate-binding protein [Cohnella sp.]|uniref:iron-siderophore ABC transporter substrate-binding protein n=1 Tax=Cohnella sp. TaxID=1883426 RepID=UPI00356716AC
MKPTSKMIAVIVAVLLLLTSTACGTTNNKPDPSAGATVNPENTPSSAKASTEEVQRIVKSIKGDITIPTEPKKVIGTTVTYPEFLYALGVTPIAAENYHEQFPSYFNETFKDVIRMGNVDTANFEAMLATEPDLIIAPAWRDEKSYDQLAKIAPTVLLPDRDDWRDELRDMGEALGRLDQAEQVIQDYDRKTMEAKENLNALVGDETVIYMRITPKGSYVLGKQSSRGKIIHQELGLKPVDAYPKDEGSVMLSLEMLPEYNPDHIILQVDSGDEAAQARTTYEDMLKSSIWKNLDSVKNNHVYLVGDNEWFNFGFSPVANTYAIDEIVNVFEENN